MSTKWIIIIILAALWVVYQGFFNKEEKGGYGPDLWAGFRLLASIIILLLLCFITALIFK